MLDRAKEQDSGHGAQRDRVPALPAAPPQSGTLAWASAVGNQAVARLARKGDAKESSARSDEGKKAAEKSGAPRRRSVPKVGSQRRWMPKGDSDLAGPETPEDEPGLTAEEVAEADAQGEGTSYNALAPPPSEKKPDGGDGPEPDEPPSPIAA